jgi:hypothetical protein
MIPYAIAIFTSAFLVFQVQPVIARFILPWYGGTPAVWTTCLLFFQLGLLAGYFYAHLLAKYANLKRQALIHLSLLVISLVLLPITPDLSVSSQASNQILDILKILALSVGFPFILLSATAPLIQHWFANIYPGRSPFRLYALSNVGSLLALLSYPFLVEPALTLTVQTWTWSAIYLLCIAVLAVCSWSLIQKKSIPGREEVSPLSDDQMATSIGNSEGKELSVGDRLIWLLLTACGSVVLIAITNKMTQDVAVVPFLWIAPLSLYLVTFIICFERDAWYQRKFWLPFLAVAVGLLMYLLSRDYADTELSLAYQIMIYCAAMFACCMVCHGELVRRRPAVGKLTVFYLYVALGGALGGVFVNLVAPLIFDGYWELHGSLILICALAISLIFTDRAVMVFWQRGTVAAAGSLGIITLTWLLGQHIAEQKEGTILSQRSFFGIVHVYQYDEGDPANHYRVMYHGRINHGDQWLDNDKQYLPTSYYGTSSGIGAALNVIRRHSDNTADKVIKVGIVGLGVGTLAAYGQPNDRFRFYEINPEVEAIASDYFSYLENSGANIEVIIGDGRRSLQNELETSRSQQYDVLVIDAFSGDAIPIHLLTREASDLYWQHLKDDGLLAIHITNFHVDLSDVVRQLAIHADKEALLISDYPTGDSASNSDWVLITSNSIFLNNPSIREESSEWSHQLREVVWTDNFSNLFDTVIW